MLAVMLRDGFEFSDDDGRHLLKTIETELHNSPNRARHAMNNALIAIGTYMNNLTTDALKTAKRIGPVIVDHGDTSCKTPDASTYIARALKRKTIPRKKKRA